MEDYRAVLNQILEETRETKKATASRIERVESKVEGHDKGLVIMSATLEKIREAMQEFSESSKAMQSDMRQAQREFQSVQAKHWQAQDKQSMQIQNILEKIANNDVRMLSVERNQVNGCPSFLNFKESRQQDLRYWEDRADRLEADVKKTRDEFEQLQKQVSVKEEKIRAANKRIEDLEADKKKGLWLIVTAFFGILASMLKSGG